MTGMMSKIMMIMLMRLRRIRGDLIEKCEDYYDDEECGSDERENKEDVEEVDGVDWQQDNDEEGDITLKMRTIRTNI